MESPLSSAIVLDESLFQKPNTHVENRYGFASQFQQRRQTRIEIDEFAEFAKKTFRRYEESNQSIDTFTLRLTTESYTRFGFATEWTLNALKLGATDLRFRSEHPSIAIPLNQVVFGNEKVVRLCLKKSKIIQLKVIKWPNLKSLTLESMVFKPDALFDILLCCPSVEDLTLSNIYVEKIRKNHSDYGDDDDDDEHVKSAPPPPAIILTKLRSLVLRGVESQFQTKALFLDDLSSKFPNLKHLTLAVPHSLWITPAQMQSISSISLETLNILEWNMNVYRTRVPRVEFDLPNIRKFKFEGVDIPDVSFRSISGNQWEESHVSITTTDVLSTAWFCQLSNFLKNLRGSKIHLCLHLHSREIFDYDVGELDGLDACEVEDLTLDIKNLPSLSCHALLDGLFRICCPKTITQYEKPPDNNNNNDDEFYVWHWMGDDRGGVNTRKNDLFICRALERAMREKGSLLVSTQFMYGLRDLEEVDAQQLIDEVWTPQPLRSVLADAADSTLQRRFRLQLKWKPFAVVS